MSELLSAAAAALGTPEALVKRSAEARAQATGASVDEILSAWAGGAPAPAAAPAEVEEAPEPETASEPAEPAAEEAASEIVIATPRPAETASTPAPARPAKPPVLVGATDNPMTVFAGVIGLFLVILLVGLVGPSIPTDTPGARTSAIAFGSAAEDGRDIYRNLGCAACHTQMVRPVVADVGLGAVTLNDSNQVLGTRRFGPDLSNVGARLSSPQIEATIEGLGGHPVHDLSAEDLSALVAYLSESVTAPEEPEEEAES